ncbi:MAG: hypothetical protein R6X14_03985 [bacterium]
MMLVLGLVTAGPAVAGVEQDFYPLHEEYWSGRVKAEAGEYSKHNSELLVSSISGSLNWNSWLKFDLDGLPVGAVVEEAYLHYHVFQLSNPRPANYVTALASDPVTAPADQLWQEIVGGMIVSNDVPHGTGWVERRLDSQGRQAVAAAIAQGWVAFGLYKYDDGRTQLNARGYQGPFKPYLRVRYSIPPVNQPDLALVAINSPAGEHAAGSGVIPEVVIRNLGDVSVPYSVSLVIRDATPDVVYSEVVELDGMEVGSDETIALPGLTFIGLEGDWSVVARVNADGDVNPDNDEAVGWFRVNPVPRGYERYGWEEVRQLPQAPSYQPVRRGGWLAVNEGNGLVYGAKGNKTNDFYGFDPVTDRWQQLAGMPYQEHLRWGRRAPQDGAQGVSDNRDYVYALQGNNSLGFWRYSISENAWEVLPDVPSGPARRRVRGGSNMVYVEVDGQGYVYLLKARDGEFYRFDVAAGNWQELPFAPAGVKARWDKGSWLVYDGMGTIYAHKPRYVRNTPEPHHELWLFDVRAGSWEQVARNGLPLLGRHGNRLTGRKAKDGAGAGWFDGGIWSLKGGNSQQYFRYDPGRNAWQESDPIPALGSSERKKLVKDGGDFVAYPRARAFYALKGNRSVEFWRYRLAPEGWVPGGGQAMPGRLGAERLSVGPTPATGPSVRLNWSLVGSQPARALVYDAAGRSVRRLELGQARTGSTRLDISGLAAGTYLVRLEGSSAPTQKLVVQR